MAHEEDLWRLFFELHQDNPQEGPGDFASTQKAFELVGELPDAPRILDVGCGPGRQTFDLLRLTNGTVTAVDKHPLYIEQLKKRIGEEGHGERATTAVADMAALDFPEASFDLIWSEGAIYCMGFEKGLQAWRPLVREGGAIAVSELTRLTSDPPEEAAAYWEGEYPAMQGIPENLATMAKAGWLPSAHFTLPEPAWFEYYNPIIAKHADFRKKHEGNATAGEVLALEEKEIEMVRKYGRHYGYVFYIARKG